MLISRERYYSFEDELIEAMELDELHDTNKYVEEVYEAPHERIRRMERMKLRVDEAIYRFMSAMIELEEANGSDTLALALQQAYCDYEGDPELLAGAVWSAWNKYIEEKMGL